MPKNLDLEKKLKKKHRAKMVWAFVVNRAVRVLASEGWRETCQPSPRVTKSLYIVIADNVGKLQMSLGWASLWNVIRFPSVLWHGWLGDRRDIGPVKSWCGDDLTGSWHVLQLQLSPLPPSRFISFTNTIIHAIEMTHEQDNCIISCSNSRPQ